jgi:hypothetical protein
MRSARRDFVKQALATGAFSGLFATPAAAKAVARFLGQTGGGAPAGHISQQQAQFWTAFADSTGTPAVQTGAFRMRGKDSGADPGRAPVFLNYTKSTGFRAITDIKPSELLPHDGDVNMGVNVAGFRAATADAKLFENLQSSQFRVDVIQKKAVLNFLDPMAWTAIAAMFPRENGKMPKLGDTGFDPGSTWQKMQSMRLPGGSGRWAFNFTLQAKESMFSQLMKTATTEIGRFAPVIGLPAISVGALSAFTSFYALVHPASSRSVFQHMPVDVFATQKSWAAQQSSVGLPLLSGDYVLVPTSQYSKIKDALPNLELQQGFVVPKGTAPGDALEVAADPTKVPDVTYVTVTAQIAPADVIQEQKPTEPGDKDTTKPS